MASSKGQGLQIGLVIFIVLTLVLGGTTFLFYQSSNKHFAALEDSRKSLTSEQAAKKSAIDQASMLKGVIGYDIDLGAPADVASETGETLMARTNYDLNNFAPDDANRTYKDTIRRQQAQIDALTTRETDLNTVINELKTEWEARKTQDQERVTLAETSNTKAVDDLKSVQDQSDRRHNETLSLLQDAQQEAKKAQTGQKQLERDLEDQKEKSDGELGVMVTTIQVLKEETSRASSVGEPVGDVVQVYYSQGDPTKNTFAYSRNNDRARAPEGFVHLNLGSRDGLRRQMTFSIWDPNDIATAYWQDRNKNIMDESGRAYEQQDTDLTPQLAKGPKGSVEVIDIIGPNQSVARITNSSILRPITTGDKVYTPIRLNQDMSVALVGSFDLTGRGTNDRDLLRSILQNRGIKIDAEVADDGTVTGEKGTVTPNTDWLVIGEIAEDVSDEEARNMQAVSTKKSELIAEAKRLSVQIIDLDKFLNFLGMAPSDRVPEEGRYTGAPTQITGRKTSYSTRPDPFTSKRISD